MKISKETCLYCGGCVSTCPVNALTLKETELDCDEKKCTSCGICKKFCPVGAILEV